MGNTPAAVTRFARSPRSHPGGDLRIRRSDRRTHNRNNTHRNPKLDTTSHQTSPNNPSQPTPRPGNDDATSCDHDDDDGDRYDDGRPRQSPTCALANGAIGPAFDDRTVFGLSGCSATNWLGAADR